MRKLHVHAGFQGALFDHGCKPHLTTACSRTGWGSRLTVCKLLPFTRGGPARGPREVARGPREVVVTSYTSKTFSLACKSHHPQGLPCARLIEIPMYTPVRDGF